MFSVLLIPTKYFSARDFGHTRNYSEEVAAQIDEEINAIVTACYQETTRKLTEHMDKLHAVAQYLFHNEKLDGEQFAALMEGKPVPGAPQTEMPAMPEVADVPPVDGEPAALICQKTGHPLRMTCFLPMNGEGRILCQ